MNLIKKIANKYKRWVLPKPVEFSHDSNWMVDLNTLEPKWDNIRKCKEFQGMIGCEHSERYHHEGDPFEHTKKVAEEMHKILLKGYDQLTGMCHIELYGAKFDLNKSDMDVLMIAALCHDLGKPSTTYYDKTEKDWRCQNHGSVGEKITRTLLMDMPINMREQICWLIRNHMVFHHILERNYLKKREKFIQLANGHTTIQNLTLLYICDALGSDDGRNIADINEAIENVVKEVYKFTTDMRVWSTRYEKESVGHVFIARLMIGVPGCGKSTIVSEMVKSEGFEVICRDNIREEINDGDVLGRKLLLDNEGEQKVTNEVNNRIKNCCKEKRSFIIDQTNMTKKGRAKLLETIHKYGEPLIEYHYVEAPSLEECIKRRGGGKWNEIVGRMWNSFDYPDYNECDTITIHKNKNTY